MFIGAMTLLSKSDCYCSTVIHTCISARSFDVNFISLVPSKGLWFNWTPTRKTRLAILNIPTSPPNTQKCAHPGLLCSKKSRVHHRCIGCGMFFLHLRTCICRHSKCEWLCPIPKSLCENYNYVDCNFLHLSCHDRSMRCFITCWYRDPILPWNTRLP